MSCYINAQIGYYEGDKIRDSDIEVGNRPSEAHDYVDGVWVLNPAKFNAIIEGQMDVLEKNEITPRSAREFQLQVTPLILKLVAPWAASLTLDQIAAELLNTTGDNYSPGYRRMFLFDQQLAVLRRQRL